MNEQLNLPPERDLPNAHAMLDDILDDVVHVGPEARPSRPGIFRIAVAAATVLAVGVLVAQVIGNSGRSPQVAEHPTPPPTVQPTTSPTEPSEAPTSSPATPIVEESPSVSPRPSGPATAMASGVGGTFGLQYFDVTVLDHKTNHEGTASGMEVKVCYMAPHPDANADGTTRTSKDPWLLGIYDGETQTLGDVHFVRVDEFPPTDEFGPAYETKNLAPGECNEGWIGFKHGNPDMAWAQVRYQPADFGDRVTWVLYAGPLPMTLVEPVTDTTVGGVRTVEVAFSAELDDPDSSVSSVGLMVAGSDQPVPATSVTPGEATAWRATFELPADASYYALVATSNDALSGQLDLSVPEG